MADGRTKRGGKKGNAITLPKRRRPSRKRTGVRETYPAGWRNVCHQIVKVFQTKLAISSPNRAGVQTLLKHIVGNFYFDSETESTEYNLTKSDLYFWLRDNTYLSPIKFGYIDFFVRTLQLDQQYDWVVDYISEYKEEMHKEFLSEIYSFRQDIENDSDGRLIPIDGLLLRSEPISSDWMESFPDIHDQDFDDFIDEFQIKLFREVWILIRNVKYGVGSLTLLYSRNRLSEINPIPNPGHCSVSFGYFIPLRATWSVPNLLTGIIKTFGPATKGGFRYGFSSSISMSEKDGLSINWDENLVTVNLLSPIGIKRNKFPSEDGSSEKEKIAFKIEHKPMNELVDFMRNLTSRYLVW